MKQENQSDKLEGTLRQLLRLLQNINFLYTILSNKNFTFGKVKVEKVEVKNGLDAAGDDDDFVEISLSVKTVHPVDNV